MVRNCKETTWKNRELNQKPLERNKKEAIYKTKTQVQMAKTKSYRGRMNNKSNNDHTLAVVKPLSSVTEQDFDFSDVPELTIGW